MRVFCLLFGALALCFCVSCTQDAYDLSRGIDREMTLFTDQVSIPLGDVGPFSPKALMSKSGIGDMLKDYVQEDEDGYLVIEKEESFFTSNPVLFIAYYLPDMSQPTDLPVSDYSGDLGSTASTLAYFGLTASPQIFTLRASNPLTDEIAVSGKLTLTSEPDGETPGEILLSRDFSNSRVGASISAGDILRVERSDGKAFYGLQVENLKLHLPGSLNEKDPNGGFSSFSLSYHYKSYVALTSDFPSAIPFDLNNLNVPLAQYKVKEARIRTEVSSEIPVTLEVESVQVLVKKTGEDGKESIDVSEDVSISPNLRISSGTSGNPVVSPLEIVIKAQTGTLPDISGLRLSFSIKAPTGAGDKRLGLSQSIIFNNIRATVSGGITIPRR